ncbi:peptidoglycan-binding domain-containing protein [Agromyces larvae]|uniref:Peptidoglycan-binding protein n=1 Tax=Agromyces larvae TaxID=2929802 RepID=A0ABY4BVD5_9MICO|nr:peptidoglycan-binding domain-containing protein [Agromyces larvae]UOE43175.1 peptidoglycan-binding protein [Agromyces larvae]
MAIGAGTVALLGGAALVGWAAFVVFAPPGEAIVEAAFTDVTVLEGEVGSSISLNTVAEWTQQPAGTNQAVGVVTAVRAQPGDEVAAGQALYEVGLRPIVVAQGETPAFRDLTVGAEGADVLQVQEFLAALGFYDGAQDGEFGTATAAAVMEWQDSLDVEDDGVVRAADIVFVPNLPARVSLNGEKVFRGATLVGGETVVSVLSGEPSFKVPVTAQQAAKIPPGTEVEITVQEAVWHAVAAGQEPSDAVDQVQITLTATDGGAICGTECALVPVEGESILPSRVITQPTVPGLVVPSAALRSSPNGTVSVIGVDGAEYPVTVVASARGMSVIEGVEAGTKVRIPAEPEASR